MNDSDDDRKPAAVDYHNADGKDDVNEMSDTGMPDDDSNELIEEGPLPPFWNPAGVYRAALVTKRQRDEKNNVATFLPPKTIGSLREQMTLDFIKCGCSKSSCLHLYCECFGSGALCKGECTCIQCKNDGSRENRDVRGKAILLQIKNPLPDGPHGENSQDKLGSNEGAKPLNSSKNEPARSPAAARLPSTYAIPIIGNNGQPVMGFDYFRATDGPPKAPAMSPSNKLVHALLEEDDNTNIEPTSTKASPLEKRRSRATSDGGDAVKYQRTDLTNLWSDDIRKVNRFFDDIRKEVKKPQSQDMIDRDSGGKSSSRETVELISKNIRDVANRVKAAEIAVANLVWAQKEEDIPVFNNTDTNYGDKDDPLYCSETLSETRQEMLSPDAMKELAILAAQDTVIIREAARLIRQKAFDMHNQRMKANSTKFLSNINK